MKGKKNRKPGLDKRGSISVFLLSVKSREKENYQSSRSIVFISIAIKQSLKAVCNTLVSVWILVERLFAIALVFFKIKEETHISVAYQSFILSLKLCNY